MKDRSRDHITTKEERNEYWRQYGEKRDELRRKSRGEAPKPVDYEIVVRDGVEIKICPWNQEMKPSGADIYFWNILEELRRELTETAQDEFLEALGRTDEASRSLLRAFSEFALDAAKASAKERHMKRVEEIEDVRIAVGFYDDEVEEKAPEEPDALG